MKCDELQAIESATAVIENVHLVYRKSEVDSAIDQLKREHHKERHEYIDMVAQLKAKLVEQESETKSALKAVSHWHDNYCELQKVVDRLQSKLECKEDKYKKLVKDHDNAIQACCEADKVIAEKDAEIAGLKAAAKEPSVPNRTCRKCCSAGTLMYMPIVKDRRTYWDLYNNKGIDYVVGIQCANCGEVAFVTKQMHEYELRKQKYKRCLAMAEMCNARYDEENAKVNGSGASWEYKSKEMKYWERWHNRWLAIAEKFKPN